MQLEVQLALCAVIVFAGCASTSPEAPRAPCPETMLYVEAGTFTMGPTSVIAEQFGIEPAHLVTLTSAYCIDRTEVTSSDFARCSSRECSVPDVDANNVDKDCVSAATHPRHPRNCVNWFEAKAFCEWRGGRLPSEAEWEHAARGSGTPEYPWGEERIDVRQDRMCYPCLPEPVGSFPVGRTPTGLEDMVGNVAEWTLDWYARYGPEHVVNPQGPASGTARVTRGGGFQGLPEKLTATARSGSPPEWRHNYVGFRCVATPR